jgi:hypothetical protein
VTYPKKFKRWEVCKFLNRAFVYVFIVYL